MKSLMVVVLLFFSVADGDRRWAARAEGSQGGRAKAAPVDAAIAAYEQAVSQNPADLEAHWKLLRALRFKGAYVASTAEEKKQIYSRAKTAGERALAALAKRIDIKGPEKKVVDSARAVPGAGQILLWDAVNWGEWALAYGKLAAARQGAADRIRREATIAHLIDPQMEGGTPSRVLGRLHDQTPRIPFITGWASGREAVKFLNESLRIEPTNKITMVFLAEAMVSDNAATKPRAIELLRKAVNAPNGEEFVVEQAAAQADAKEILRKWGV